MSRTKVVVHRNGWRRLLALLCISFVIVILTLATLRWTDYTRPAVPRPGMVTGSSSIHVGIIVGLLLLLPLWLAVLSWSEQRWWYATLEALAVWLGMVLGTSGWHLRFSAPSPQIRDTLEVSMAIALIYLPVRLFALALVRFVIVSIIYQDGTLCSSCGYNLTGNVSGICPECGTPCERITAGEFSPTQSPSP